MDLINIKLSGVTALLWTSNFTVPPSSIVLNSKSIPSEFVVAVKYCKVTLASKMPEVIDIKTNILGMSKNLFIRKLILSNIISI